MSCIPSSRRCVSSISLGKHPSHTLERKISAASVRGFSAIELVFRDLDGFAKQHSLPLIEAATTIKELCKAQGITILALCAFVNFEGNLKESLDDRLKRAREWVSLARALGTQIVQVPSQFLPNSTGDEAVIIAELRALCDAAVEGDPEHPIKITYESVAFAAHYPRWQDGLQTVEKVDRPNLGLVLDSFHIHALLWSDPFAADGQIVGGDEALRKSMQELVESLPKERVHFIQLSDSSRFDPPLREDDERFESLEVKKASLLQSRHARPFPLEKSGYFPIVEFTRTLLVEWGWDGWVSLEGFLTETEREDNGPEAMAQRAETSFERLMKAL